jgi:hypothetical protein
MTRRDAVRVSLVTAATLVVTGCLSPERSGPDLASAQRQLKRALDDVADDEVARTRLYSIAEQIERRARQLVEEHEAFLVRFDELSRNRGTTESELMDLVDSVAVRQRTALRDDLLRLQDELRAEVTRDDWAIVAEVLNGSGGRIHEPRLQEG